MKGAPESRDTGPCLHVLSSCGQSDPPPSFTFLPGRGPFPSAGQTGLSFSLLSLRRTTMDGLSYPLAQSEAACWNVTGARCGRGRGHLGPDIYWLLGPDQVTHFC